MQVDVQDCPRGTNTGTNHGITIRGVDEMWAAVDALPPAILHHLHSAPADMDAVEVLEFWREGRQHGWPDWELAKVVEQQIAIAARRISDEWGPGYPMIRFTPLVPRRTRPARRRRQYLR